MALPADDLLALIVLSRNIIWRYQLDTYEDESLAILLNAVQRAEQEILEAIGNYATTLPDWSEERSLALLDEFSDLTLGVRTILTGGVAEIASQAGAASFLMHNDIVSFDGRVPNFNYVSLTAEQMRALLDDFPVGGGLLNEWVELFYANAAGSIRENILTGMLKGDSYPQFVNRLTQQFSMTRQEAINLARTYVQGVNTFSQDVTYKENADIVTGVKWTATLEPGYAKNGHGTCLRCAVLDGQTFPLNGPRPDCPLHINCRCLYLPELVSWRSLGVDMDEIPETYRPYTIRPDKAIGEGGRRTIIEHGFYDGDYRSWMTSRSESFKKELLGPNRYELLSSGRINFGDLVNRETGKLLTLSELGR